MYISDGFNYKVRKVDASGIISTFAGSFAGPGYSGDGFPPTATAIGRVSDVIVDNIGGVYMAIEQRIIYVGPTACSSTPDAGTISSSATAGCGTYTANIYLTGGTVATGLSYKWMVSPDSSTWAIVAGATASTYAATVTSTVYYKCAVTCTASGGRDTTAGIKLVELVPILSPISGVTTVCAGATTPLSDTATGGAWSSVNTGIATVNTAGIVYGVAGGTATIQYTKTNACGTTTRSVVVTVTPTPLAGSISGPAAVCAGAGITLFDAASGGAWSSGNTGVATINASGGVTGVTAGSVILSYTVPGTCGPSYAAYTVNVTGLPTVSPISGAMVISAGSLVTLTDLVSGGVWSSASTSVATISPSSGMVHTAAPGTTTISYTVANTCGSVNATAVVSVAASPAVAPISGVHTLCANASHLFIDATPSGSWSSAEPGIATVGGSGIVTGILAGTASIVYTVAMPACTSGTSFVVTVNPAPTAVITYTGSTTICPGGSLVLSAPAGAGLSYQWHMGPTIIAGATTANYTATAAGGYNVIVTNSLGCFLSSVPVTVFASGEYTATVHMTAAPGGAVCATSTVVFTAMPVFGGSSPSYTWRKNGVVVDTHGVYVLFPPTDGDAIQVTMTSNYHCLTSAAPVSSTIYHLSVLAPVNKLFISASDSVIHYGETVTFTATAVGGGISPAYQWFINSMIVSGGTAPVFTTNALHDGDVVTCTETTSESCFSPFTATTRGINITVLSASGLSQSGQNNKRVIIYPNPAGRSINVSFEEEINSISVSNILGEMLYANSFINKNNATIDISSFSPGIYFVKVNDIFRGKFIKE